MSLGTSEGNDDPDGDGVGSSEGREEPEGEFVDASTGWLLYPSAGAGE